LAKDETLEARLARAEQELESMLLRLQLETDIERLLGSLPGEQEAMLEAMLLRLAEEKALLDYLMCSDVAFLASLEDIPFF